jgi:hypothetical protein
MYSLISELQPSSMIASVLKYNLEIHLFTLDFWKIYLYIATTGEKRSNIHKKWAKMLYIYICFTLSIKFKSSKLVLALVRDCTGT